MLKGLGGWVLKGLGGWVLKGLGVWVLRGWEEIMKMSCLGVL